MYCITTRVNLFMLMLFYAISDLGLYFCDLFTGFDRLVKRLLSDSVSVMHIALFLFCECLCHLRSNFISVALCCVALGSTWQWSWLL